MEMPLKKEIYLYQDDGVSLQAFEQFSSAFKHFTKHSYFELKKIRAYDLLESDFWLKASCLVFLGGRDLPYHEKLRGKGCQKIRSYVENGGSYLGICAGAYFAASEIVFEKGTPLEVHQKRELCFFSKRAIGAVYSDPPFSYEGQTSATAALVSFDKETLFVYYNGGCTFSDLSDEKVWGRYQEIPNQPPALIECPVGLGRAVLSGVHFEIEPKYVVDKKELFQVLEKNEEKRKRLFNLIMNRLLS